ncbi:RluA family pseudouridine synthase [Ruminococcus gauvreauii]|uniref:Pseudouridine synthase n=1 Tax=Ruminococcus gauvreauii TaxID=438033 RepID=A0ABY5VHG9_9FIRM|nr:RluA family pseudouridine synthase [Ruminococcus gauvreauii]UWP59837.1 RluA family pseudouridine synthase [Ruminococcus gauvreauii]
MNRILTYPVTAAEAGMSIGEYLQSRGYSRHLIIHLKQTPLGLHIGGRKVMTSHRLSAGETLTVQIIEEQSSEKIPPSHLPLSIVYEDDDLLILNKPADMPVHPSLGNYENTLANGIAYYYQGQGLPFVFRCINRLDRDTTGLLILAKNMLSAAVLSRQMKERKISRTYLALVRGNPEPSSGTIDAPIARIPGSVLERRVSPDGESAVTHYQVRKQLLSSALVELHLETGRTHQIRVHMKHIGHPLLGDFLYHPKDSSLSRQALHSYSLRFIHPITGCELFFHAPLPPDMQEYIRLHEGGAEPSE